MEVNLIILQRDGKCGKWRWCGFDKFIPVVMRSVLVGEDMLRGPVRGGSSTGVDLLQAKYS